MGYYSSFYFNSGENQQTETVIHITPDSRSAIHGYVKDLNNIPIKDAIVLLFETGDDPEDIVFAARVITDETGNFIFGPLIPNKLYLIKVYKDMIRIRELEIRPEI